MPSSTPVLSLLCSPLLIPRPTPLPPHAQSAASARRNLNNYELLVVYFRDTQRQRVVYLPHHSRICPRQPQCFLFCVPLFSSPAPPPSPHAHSRLQARAATSTTTSCLLCIFVILSDNALCISRIILVYALVNPSAFSSVFPSSHPPPHPPPPTHTVGCKRAPQPQQLRAACCVF